MIEKFLPAVMIVLSVLSSVVYAVDGDGRRAIYWIASATLIAAVTF